MKRILFLMLCSLILTGLVFIAGCGDDDNGTGSTTKETGDLNDPNFQMVVDLTEEVDGVTGYMFDFIGQMLDTIFNHPDNPSKVSLEGKTKNHLLAASDSVLVTYHSNTGYWYAYAASIDTNMYDTVVEIFTMIVEDSTQFKHGSTVVQWPDSMLLTEVTNGISISVSNDWYQSSITAHQLINVTGDSLFTNGLATINGTQTVNMNLVDITNTMTGDSCTFGVSLGTTLNDIVMNVVYEEDCPSSGNLLHNGTINIACTGDTTFTFNNIWTISQTFENQYTYVVFENATTRWTYTDTCGFSVPGVSTETPFKFLQQ